MNRIVIRTYLRYTATFLITILLVNCTIGHYDQDPIKTGRLVDLRRRIPLNLKIHNYDVYEMYGSKIISGRPDNYDMVQDNPTVYRKYPGESFRDYSGMVAEILKGSDVFRNPNASELKSSEQKAMYLEIIYLDTRSDLWDIYNLFAVFSFTLIPARTSDKYIVYGYVVDGNQKTNWVGVASGQISGFMSLWPTLYIPLICMDNPKSYSDTRILHDCIEELVRQYAEFLRTGVAKEIPAMH